MLPFGALPSHFSSPRPCTPPGFSRGSPMKAASSPSSHGSLFRKTGRFLGGSSATLREPPSLPRESDALTVNSNTSSERPGTLSTVTESSSESHSLQPGTSRHRRGSSVSSLTDFGSSIRRRSTSLRGHGPRSPESSKLAPPTSNPRDTRPSTAAGDYKAPHQPNGGFVFSRIQDLATKRISTLDYMKKAHEGRTYWFNTLYFHRADLAKLPYFEQQKLVRRATNFFMLGNSIPPVLDPNMDNIVEYLRTFNALLTEFDAYQSLHPPDGSAASTMSRVRMPHMFKRVTSGGQQGKVRRGSEFGSMMAASESSDNLALAGGHGGPGIHSELGSGQDYVYLLTPSLPFDPDYFETFATLCDVLIDCYTTILSLVTSADSVGPPAAAELFAKVDMKVKKILMTGIVRDFEQASKQGVRGELAGVGKVVLGGLM